MKTTVDTTNVDAGTAYYPDSSGFPMEEFKGGLSIQGVISGGVTATIEVSNDETFTDWVDITDSLYNWIGGAARYASSYVDTSFLFQMDKFMWKYARIKSVTSDASNAVQYNVRLIK